MEKKKVSSLEFKLAQILGLDDIVRNSSPRTLEEEEVHADKKLSEQLKSFRFKEQGNREA